ncbi:GNAT family N-acetyltransferase [Saccharomonospora sp. NB11]|uniref:GNAT family N-acetyltransferase n=1 Tax=Saccharomonospora sp. NB11 TaxID=1642298 RepID=UPI0018D09601|nr:GNAT family N-acetyltransferase [Saccharomonospora sp. NB11]
MTFTRLDPLLPEVVDPGEGELLTVSVAGGGTVSAVVYRARHDGWSALWHPRVVWELAPVSPDVGTDGMAALLDALRRRLRDERPGTDTACSVTWPSRDLAVSEALASHGFVPSTVLAVREAAPPEDAPSTEVRPVTASDGASLADLLDLWLAEWRHAISVGAAIDRPDAAALLAGELRRAISAEEPMWVAEIDGVLAGLALARWPAPHPRLPSGSWAHVHTVSVAADVRRRGVGRALVATAHGRLLARGARGTYVFYSPHNALSTVFWHRRGYRPLWTTWEARPATATR